MLQWDIRKQTWSVDDSIKAIFNDESRSCIGQSDDVGTSLWCSSNATYKDACLKQTNRFIHSLMIDVLYQERDHRRWHPLIQ